MKTDHTEMSSWESKLNGESLSFIEELYAQYLRDPQNVEEEWRLFFDELPLEFGLDPDHLAGPQKTSAPICSQKVPPNPLPKLRLILR